MALEDKTFPEVIDFTRPNAAPYVNASGQTVTAAINEPRLTHTSSGAPLGLLLESALTERAVIRDGSWRAPNRGTWIVRGIFDKAVLLSGLGFYIEADGEGTIVVTFSLSGAKVFANGAKQYETGIRALGAFNILDREMATVARMEFIPAMLSDSEAAGLTQGAVSVQPTLEGLYSRGEKGFLWSLFPYYQEPAGTTVASWGNPVGLIRDASGNSANMTQATVTARPILGRVPVGGRRNLLPSSVNFGSGYWDAQAITTSAASGPYGETDAYSFTPTTESRSHRAYYLTGTQVADNTFSLHVKGNGYTRINVRFENISSGAQLSSTSFRLEGEGSVTSGPGQIESVGDGWYRVSVSAPISSSSFRPFLYIQNESGEQGYSGDGVSGIYLWGGQLEIGMEMTAYQNVLSAYDITESGVPGVYYLRFDGTDDSVSTTLPAITNGTVVIAGTNGIWIDDDFNHAGGTFSIGPTTYTGGPAGILSIVGDLIVGGSFVIDRQLTAEERTRVINKLKGMGAGLEMRWGPERLTNGHFTDGLEGWTVTPNATGSVSDGALTLAVASNGNGAWQSVPVTPGDVYYVSAKGRRVSGSGVAGVRLADGVFSSASFTVRETSSAGFGDLSFFKECLENTLTTYLRVSLAGAVGEYKELSLRKLEYVS